MPNDKFVIFGLVGKSNKSGALIIKGQYKEGEDQILNISFADKKGGFTEEVFANAALIDKEDWPFFRKFYETFCPQFKWVLSRLN